MASAKLAEKAGILNITIEQGATFNPVLTWKDENGVVIDLTGYSARMQIRDTVDATSFIAELTDLTGEIVLGGTAGTITFNLSAAATAAFTFDSAVYDLELVNGTIVNRLLKGEVILSKEVTR